jgi:hypothetical protein
MGYQDFLKSLRGIIFDGNPPVNAMNGFNLKSLISISEAVRTIGTPPERPPPLTFLCCFSVFFTALTNLENMLYL